MGMAKPNVEGLKRMGQLFMEMSSESEVVDLNKVYKTLYKEGTISEKMYNDLCKNTDEILMDA
jgi:acyl-[acyl carrier protein]--UDP-N-acetylglucosamine O-acyltransferase